MRQTRIALAWRRYDLLRINQGRLETRSPNGATLKSFDQVVYMIPVAPGVTSAFNATRESSCDETFASLSHNGDVSFLDPQMKPSWFLQIHGSLTELPPPQATLPCYEVK
jgi:hypothetical protein